MILQHTFTHRRDPFSAQPAAGKQPAKRSDLHADSELPSAMRRCMQTHVNTQQGRAAMARPPSADVSICWAS